MKRHLKIIIGLGIPLGIVLAIVKNTMNIDEELFWKIYLIIGCIVIVGAVFINFLYELRFIKKLKIITNEMKEQKKFDSFFLEIENMLKKYKSNYNRCLLLLNLAYGYGEKKEYEKGIEILNSIEQNSIKGINKIVYYLNLICFNFYLNNYEEVINLTERYNHEFLKFKEKNHLSWNIAANSIYYYIAKGEYELAKNLLIDAKKKWTEKDMMEEWQTLDSILNAKKDR